MIQFSTDLLTDRHAVVCFQTYSLHVRHCFSQCGLFFFVCLIPVPSIYIYIYIYIPEQIGAMQVKFRA